MNPAFDALMNEVCVRLGFCGSVKDGKPLHVSLFLPGTGLVSADAFADAVFKAEGWEPNGAAALGHRKTVRDAFVLHMGGTDSDARLLR